MSKKLVVVCGATGAHGGSVVTSLLEDGRYAIRGITRDVNSASAQALIAKGVEIVPGQPGDKESVMKAFKGAYAVFGLTNPTFTPGPEYEQGKNLVDACKANDVSLFVWSSLPHVAETSNGKYTGVFAFDEKAEVDKYIKSIDQPAIVFKTSGFTSNLVKFGELRRDAQDPPKWHIYGPYVRANFPRYATYVEKDLGPSVVAVINHWEDPAVRAELEKEPIPLCSYNVSGNEKAEIVSKISGTGVDFIVEHPTEGRNALPMLKSMYKWADEDYVHYPGGVPPPILLKLGVKFHSFEEYVKETVVPFMKSQQ
ncbi:NAD(P)-binding protein [Calocera viscosa TUFC12733]|uniref:NAD(P)-binding protein n=1 Tax=Calocera viscosa (strain TUFC12733) TaxID=1330018 RepID=A0A167KKD6_CALVF|nr:NAD(P)-binding protein [Calocera viscosa TUFC12733]